MSSNVVVKLNQTPTYAQAEAVARIIRNRGLDPTSHHAVENVLREKAMLGDYREVVLIVNAARGINGWADREILFEVVDACATQIAEDFFTTGMVFDSDEFEDVVDQVSEFQAPLPGESHQHYAARLLVHQKLWQNEQDAGASADWQYLQSRQAKVSACNE